MADDMGEMEENESPEDMGEMDWKADGDCRTLIEAEQIKKDKPRLKAAMKKAKEKMAALKELESNE